jgi:hypothetical protein
MPVFDIHSTTSPSPEGKTQIKGTLFSHVIGMEHQAVSSLLRTMIIASELPRPQQQHFLIDHGRHKVACLLQALAISLGSHHMIKTSHDHPLHLQCCPGMQQIKDPKLAVPSL